MASCFFVLNVMYKGLKRCGKSCRLRWMNYLSPNVKRGKFTEEEEDLIIRLHKLLGNRFFYFCFLLLTLKKRAFMFISVTLFFEELINFTEYLITGKKNNWMYMVSIVPQLWNMEQQEWFVLFLTFSLIFHPSFGLSLLVGTISSSLWIVTEQINDHCQGGCIYVYIYFLVIFRSWFHFRWSLIAKRVPGRTDNQVKNYWNTHLRKKLGFKEKRNRNGDSSLAKPQKEEASKSCRGTSSCTNASAATEISVENATQKGLRNVSEIQESMSDESFVNSLWNAADELDFVGTLTMLEFMDGCSLSWFLIQSINDSEQNCFYFLFFFFIWFHVKKEVNSKFLQRYVDKEF